MIKYIYWLIFRKKKVVSGGVLNKEQVKAMRELSSATGITVEETSKILCAVTYGFNVDCELDEPIKK
tara:strand:+ start:2879 stop:3079 length:201 start_codon:yes stop_codon:yes gene_type:complete